MAESEFCTISAELGMEFSGTDAAGNRVMGISDGRVSVNRKLSRSAMLFNKSTFLLINASAHKWSYKCHIYSWINFESS